MAPTLLVWGEGDRLIPSTAADRWMEALADARLQVIANARHVPMFEAPEELIAVISHFRSER
jgi:pimeloyl-ACP methyl ester carboxylesterase